MPAMPRVIVMGGSLGGLTAALLLRDAGCDVRVAGRYVHRQAEHVGYDQAVDPDGPGAGQPVAGHEANGLAVDQRSGHPTSSIRQRAPDTVHL